jgi:hypothetical protein
MSFIPINPPPGQMLNGTDYEAQGRWRYANLIRFFRESPQPVGGWTSLPLTIRDSFDRPILRDTLDGICRGLLTWRDNEENRWLALGTTRDLYVHDGSELFTITPDDLDPGDENTNHGDGYGAYIYNVDEYGTARAQPIISLVEEPGAWTFDTWGDELIACPNWDGKLYSWAPGDPQALQIVGALGEVPEKNRAVLVTNERHMVAIGAGIFVTGVFEASKRRIAWSTSENYEEWFPTPTNSAGDLELDSKGIAMCGAKFRSEVLIWSDIDVHRMSYIGAPFYYNLKRLSPASGIASVNANVVTSAFAFWVGPQGFFIYDGAVRELSPDISDFYRDDVNTSQFAKICCGHNPLFNEVWTFYPSNESNEIDSYVLWNYEENTWAVGRLSRSNWNQASVWANPIATEPINLPDATVTDRLYLNLIWPAWRKLEETTRTVANVVVKSESGTLTYTPGTDYEVDFNLGMIRTRVEGVIPNHVNLLISFDQIEKGYSKVFNQEDGMTDDSLDRDIWLETAPFEIATGDKLAVVNRIIQDTGRKDDQDPVLNSDAVEFTFTTRLAPEAEATTHGPYTLDTVRGYTNVRFTGREVVMRINQVKNELWRVGRNRLDIVPGSGR